MTLSLALIFIDQRSLHIHLLRYNLSLIAYPFEWAINYPLDIIASITSNLKTHNMLIKQNKLLRSNQLILQAKTQRQSALENENAELRSLLGAMPTHSQRMMVAELIAINNEPFTQQVVIDKGSHEGVYVGQPVLDSRGIIGQVIFVGPYTSRVLLICDRSSAIPVENSRNAVRAIAVGTGIVDQLQLQYVPVTTDVAVGDIMLSSGLDQRYPEGYPVGVVIQVQHQKGAHFSKITLAPTAGLNRSRLFLLIWPNKHITPALLPGTALPASGESNAATSPTPSSSNSSSQTQSIPSTAPSSPDKEQTVKTEAKTERSRKKSKTANSIEDSQNAE